LTDIYQSLGEDGKAKVMQTLFTKIGTQNNAKKEMDEENRTARELEAVDIYKRLDSASGSQKKAMIKRLVDLRVVSFEEIKNLSTGEGSSGNSMAMFNATAALYDGTITTTEQIAKLPISVKDKLTLLGKFHSNDRADDRDLDSGLRRLAGVPIGFNFVDPKGAEFTRKAQLDRDAERVRQDLMAQGKPSNSRAILDVLGKELEAKKNTEGAKAARVSLKPYEDKAGGEITSATYEAFAIKVKAGKVKNVTEKDLPRIKNLVNQAEGIQ